MGGWREECGGGEGAAAAGVWGVRCAFVCNVSESDFEYHFKQSGNKNQGIVEAPVRAPLVFISFFFRFLCFLPTTGHFSLLSLSLFPLALGRFSWSGLMHDHGNTERYALSSAASSAAMLRLGGFIPPSSGSKYAPHTSHFFGSASAESQGPLSLAVFAASAY